LITGAYGMADIIRRAMPPDFAKIDMVWWPALETIDLGIFGTVGGVIMAFAARGSRRRQRDAVPVPLLRRARPNRLRPRRP
jgi:ABC-type phosphate/phosphonate transport system permease subunit